MIDMYKRFYLVLKKRRLQLYFSTMINMILSFEIRITTKIEVKMVSWSKFLRMDTGSKIGFPYSFFIDEEKKVFMCS